MEKTVTVAVEVQEGIIEDYRAALIDIGVDGEITLKGFDTLADLAELIDKENKRPLEAVNDAEAFVSDENHPMREAIEDNADRLGLDLTDYNSMKDGRKRAINIDLFNNKPEEDGYTVETLQAMFDEIVATRMTFEESVELFSSGTAENPLTDLTYITMLIDRLEVVSYETHSGNAIKGEEGLISDLQDLVDRFNALDKEYQAEVLSTITYTSNTSSSATRKALKNALGEVEATVAPAKATEAVHALFVLDEEGEFVLDDESKVLAEDVTQKDITAASKLIADDFEEGVKTNLNALIVEAQGLLEDQVTEAVEALLDEEGKLVADKAEIDAASVLVEVLNDGETKTGLQELIDVAYINLAIMSDDAMALQAIIVEANVSEYIDLSRAQRGELVQFIIDKALAAEEYVPVTGTEAFKTSIGAEEGEVAKYKEAIAAVNNKENNKGAMQTALEEVYDVYADLTAVQQLDVAEIMLTIVKADDFVAYTTFAEIIEAVDTVIADLGL